MNETRLTVLNRENIEILEVLLVTHGDKDAQPLYLNVHDDENDCVAAARTLLEEPILGRVSELRHRGDRRIRFRAAGHTWTFDPNRMFTPAGVREDMDDPPDVVMTMVGAFAAELLAATGLPDEPLCVALHNNWQQGWGVRSFLPGEEDAACAEQVHVAPGQPEDDFYLVTVPEHFAFLAGSGYNAVLQKQENPPDDGSLSVWCAQHDIPYINVESRRGHAARAEALIRAIQPIVLEIFAA